LGRRDGDGRDKGHATWWECGIHNVTPANRCHNQPPWSNMMQHSDIL
jgi:hypothetical protein